MVEEIKHLCKLNGISMRKLERLMGIGNGVIGKWDKGSPTLSSLISVADYFGVSLDYLAGRISQETVPKEISTVANKLNQEGLDMLKIFAEGLASQEQFRKDTK